MISATWAAPSPTTGGCDRESLVKLGKAISTFGRLWRIWASWNISTCVKDRQAVQLTSPGSVTLWSRDLANDKINDQEIGNSTSQVAQKDLTHFVER